MLHSELKAAGYATGLGDEGGFAPDLKSNREGLDFLVKAIEKAGFKVGSDIALGMDVAASEFHDNGVYTFEGKPWTAEALTDYYVELADAYPIVTIEDALDEDDWDSWKHLTEKLGSKIQLVGDDLFVTNPERLKKGIDLGVGNSLLVKVNQIGTLSETLDAVDMAHRAGLHHDVLAPLRRDRGHHDRRPRRRGELGSDQERRARPQRARREIQSASAHRGRAGRRGGVHRPRGVPALQGLTVSAQMRERGSRGEQDGSPFSLPPGAGPRVDRSTCGAGSAASVSRVSW